MKAKLIASVAYGSCHASKAQLIASVARVHRPSRLLMGLVALFVGWACLTSVVQAQSLKHLQPVAPAESVVNVPVVEVTTLGALHRRDLSGMSPAWWRNVVKQHTRVLGSSDEQLKEAALVNILVFTKTYDVNFKRATSRLFKIYRSDRNEAHRIMALAALHAIGDRYAMERVHEQVATEKSERVRRHTLLALADYYKNRGAQ